MPGTTPPRRDSPELKLLGGRLRRARHERGMSLAAVGRRIGVAHSHISEVERGERNLSLLRLLRITTALELPTSWVFEDTDEVPPPCG